jgi:hypothetical protein
MNRPLNAQAYHVVAVYHHPCLSIPCLKNWLWFKDKTKRIEAVCNIVKKYPILIPILLLMVLNIIDKS